MEHEDVYLKAYDGGQQAQRSRAEYFGFYDTARKQQGLGRQAPDRVGFIQLSLPQASDDVRNLSLAKSCGLSR